MNPIKLEQDFDKRPNSAEKMNWLGNRNMQWPNL